MNELISINAVPVLPALVVGVSDRADIRFLEFFAANICNSHTRRD
jgi:hypothetical protein